MGEMGFPDEPSDAKIIELLNDDEVEFFRKAVFCYLTNDYGGCDFYTEKINELAVFYIDDYIEKLKQYRDDVQQWWDEIDRVQRGYYDAEQDN